jgi:predicted ATPase
VSGRSTFFGRESELRRLLDLVAEHRLVTVTGVGGVGKTRLVEEAIPTLRDEHGDRVDTIALVRLDADADAAAISGQLGMTSPEAIAVAQRDCSSVIVLDSCEHVIEGACDFVSRVLAAGDSVSVVATSRAPLGIPGEQVLVVGPLPLPPLDDPDPLASPAVGLLLERAAAGGAAWERTPQTLDAIAQLCRRVDGLPLAIELAASRARALSPVDLLSLMEHRLDALRADHPGRPVRHRSVRAAIDVSVDLLDEDALAFFHGLAVLAGPFDLDLAHAVAGPDGHDRLRTVDLLGELVDRSLVVPEAAGKRTTYRLLELVHDHAADALRATQGWTDANERLTDAIVDHASRIAAEGRRGWSADLIERVVSTFGNLATGIEWCLTNDSTPERAFRLFGAMYAAVHQSRSGEVRAIGERILSRWPDVDARGRPGALAVLATAYAISAFPDRATELAEIAIASPSASPAARVVARRSIMLVAIARGDIATARRAAARARREAAGAGLGPFERELAGFEASLLDREGRHDAAAAMASASARAAADSGDHVSEVWARLVLTSIAMRAQRHDDAAAELALAEESARPLNDAWWGGALLRCRGALTAAAGGGWDGSASTWRTAIERAARRGDLPELALTLKAAAVIAHRAGKDATAAALLDALPHARELTVLPSLFDGEDDRLAATHMTAHRGEHPTLVTALRLALAAIDVPAPAPTASELPAEVRPALRKEGDVWAITFGGRTARVRDLKGLHDLAALLSRPGEEVHCLELMGASRVDGDTGPALDERAKREYQQRVVELQNEIDDARNANDPARAEKSEHELDLLVQQLSEAFGLGGRARVAGSTGERARTAVTYRIRAATKRVAEVHPELGRHLDNAVRTGTWCAYRPEADINWDVHAG